MKHLPPSRRKRLTRRVKRPHREIRVVGVVLREEPLLSPKLPLEKDTFSGGYNVTIRERNERRRAEWREQNDRVVKIEAHTDALGFRHQMMILVPSHLWEKVAETASRFTKPPKPQWYTWSAKSHKVSNEQMVEAMRDAEHLRGRVNDWRESWAKRVSDEEIARGASVIFGMQGRLPGTEA